MRNESEKLNLNDEELEKLEAELLPTQALRESLEMSDRGNPKQTINNAVIVFKDDPMFKNHLRINLFRDQIEFTGDAHWKRKGIDVSEMDEIHIRHYLETEYQLVNEKKIKEALMIAGSESAYHPVREYLESLSWDGKERIRYCEHIMFIANEAQNTEYFAVAVTELTEIMKVRSHVKSAHQEIYRLYSGKGIEIVGDLTYKVRVLNDLFGDELSIKKGTLMVRREGGRKMPATEPDRAAVVA